ncbi:MAG: bifunctional (p)ppGpp synthetase/guanosine-3',5'-bis(diphosphate) 3'-pyrophosphohydrolase [Candidatus Gastranaerophilales bacterium]|nr:bifunctional (p)ppGpp synthetase/guanosine-3',5'-bis(diphosphate) 3'-pyrophosphohydrolase [Candidatus Gastranaerophilales bacterium]
MTHLTHFLEVKQILLSQNRRSADIARIEQAYLFAAKLHEGQYRISEEPYIIHPIEVAKILADLKMDTDTIIAAFLHDILEDTETEPGEIEKNFGSDVLKLVQGVTKLGKYQFKSKEERQAENFRRMFIAMAEDARIIFLKLADRLHNMRTLNYMAQNKQKRIAKETLDIFAPLANRLGIGKIKAELEDLSLRYIDPEKYYQIAKLVAQTKKERESLVNSLIEITKKHLDENGVQATIYGRAKHYYSIYNKMRRLNVSFDQLYDIVAIRVIVKDEKDCYNALGIIHSQFKPIPGRFKDYIAMPKGNMYRSLHTSVIGLKNKPFEIQIRTKEMHEVAEYGLAAHWRYKESGSVKASNAADIKFNWMRKLIEISKDETDAKEFVESVKLDLFSDQVFTFTPAGDVIDLPIGSTPVDFAYRIHTEVGHRTVGALVNARIVQLDTKLQNGDIVEILTSKQCMPKIDWLDFVATKNAAGKIRAWFKKYKREDNVELGRINLENELTKSLFDELLKSGEIDRTAHEMNYKNANDLFAALGYGETTLRKVLNKINKPVKKDLTVINHEVETYNKKKPSKKNDIIGLEDLVWSLAKCCSPLPGEPIVGVVTRSKGVSVHRLDCKCLFDIDPNRMMDIHWADKVSQGTYVAHIRIEAQERVGLLKDVLVKIADTNTNVSYAYSYSKNKKFGIIDLGIELSDIETLKKIITNLQSMPDVYSVRRLQQKNDPMSQRTPKKTKNKRSNLPKTEQKNR